VRARPLGVAVPLLGVARIMLGTVFVVRTTALANLLPIPLAHVRGPLYGWPEAGWPMAFGGIVLPPTVRIVACLVRTAAAVCFLAGIRARVAGVVAGALGLLAMQQDPFGFIFTLYTLFVGTIVLASTDGNGVLAWRADAPLDVRSSAILVRMVCGTVYVWAAIAKMHGQWLRGDTLLALSEDGLLTSHVASVLRSHAGLRVVDAWRTIAAELGIGLVLAVGAPLRSARIRLVAIAAALGMHTAFEVATRPDVIGWVMASLLVACGQNDDRSKVMS
jgi:hypothetical protein